MAPTPFTATGKLRCAYVVQSLEHFQDIACTIDLGPTPPQISRIGALASVTGQQALDIWWTTVSAFYPSSVLTPTFVLYQVTGGGTVFIPRDSGAGTGGPGTNTGTLALTTLLSFTYRDISNVLAKFALNEVCYEAPGRSTQNTTPSVFAAYRDSILGSLASDIGSFAQSRAADTMITARYLFWTNSLNRRTRKRRSLI